MKIRPRCPHRRRRAYRCPALAALDGRARLVGALAGAGLWAPKVRVVAQGLDTLHLFTRRPLALEWRARLEAARLEADELGTAPELEIGACTVAMQAHGAGGARWLLESDLWAFKVTPQPRAGYPTVTLELRALGLWANGWRRAARLGLEAVAELCACTVDELDAQVTRADLAIDFQGWVPAPDELERFTTRATTRGAHAGSSWEWLQAEEGREAVKRKRRHVLELAKQLHASSSIVEAHQILEELSGAAAEDASAATTWRHGRRLTGFSLGRGHLAARLYDKRREIGVSCKHWMRTVWRGWAPAEVGTAPSFEVSSGAVSPYLEDGEVWRLEFQIRREGLLSLEELEAPEPGADWSGATLGSWAHFVGRLDSLWAYLTSRWLRHGTRTKDDRQATSIVWKQIQRAWSSSEAAPVALHRPAVEAARVVVVPQLAGLLATAAAQVEVLAEDELAPSSRPAAALPYWRTLLAAVRAAHAYSAEKEEPIAQRCRSRAEAMRRRGTALKGSAKAHRARLAGAGRLLSSGVPRRWWEGARWKSPSYTADGRGEALAGPAGLVHTVSMKRQEVGW